MWELNFRNQNLDHIIRLIQGDITEQSTDAIVNAANSQLILGAGVAGAIRKMGGPTIQEECSRIGYTEVGSAAITTGGKLKAKFVIHAVGPVWADYSESQAKQLLYNAIEKSMVILEQKNLKSITFPAISTGIFGFPKIEAAIVMKQAILHFLQQAKKPYIVQICLFSPEDYDIFEQIFKTN